MKKLIVGLALFISACGIIHLKGGSTELDASWDFAIDTMQQSIVATARVKSTQQLVAQCNAQNSAAVREAIKAFDFIPHYTIPTEVGAPVDALLTNATGTEIASCNIYIFTVWQTWMK